MNKSKTRKLRLPLLSIIFSLFCLAVLYGCGNAPDSGTPPTPGAATLTLSFSANTVTFGTPVTATATLKNASGTPIPNTVVTFTADSNLVVFTNLPAAALTDTDAAATVSTDANGNASVFVNAASFDSSGATSITASASVTTGGTTSTVTSTPFGINVRGATVTINSLTLSNPTIPAYGNSSVSAAVWINGAPATVPVSVTFTSPCVANGKATLSTPVNTVSGTATSTYTDNYCASTTDLITASVSGGNNAKTTINVTLPAIKLNVSSNIATYGTPVTATATLKDSNGAAVPNTVVTFAATSNLIVFSQTTKLTDASGVASVTLDAASISSSGATSIMASAPVTTGGTTSTITSKAEGISVNGAAVTIQSLTLGSPSISSYGTTSVSALVWLNGAPATVPISVAFTSSCGNKATLDTPVTTNTATGIATSTYKDNNCASGSDMITASVTGNTKSVTITVVPPAASNIKFVSATPEIIGTKGTGASTLSQSSVVKFKVMDSNNNANPNVTVNFSLVPVSAPGGITLSSTSATSDANGEVTTAVTSGTVPTPVWVVAKVSDTILTQSNKLTITTGLPAQEFLSLSASIYNIEGLTFDGTKSTLTIIASDRMGNPVPDGTAINFITAGAQITPSCTTTNGTCSVTFTSAQYKPPNGRVKILAYTLGEKSFIDADGTNSYTTGETFYDLGDPYVDANENGQWDTGENFIPSSIAGSLACLTQPAGTPLPVSYVDAPSRQNTCNALWGSNYVRRSTVMLLSGSTAYTSSPTTVSMGALCAKTFSFWLRDINNHPMPAGSKVTLENEAIYYTSSSGATWTTTNTISGTPVSNSSDTGGTQVSLTVDGTSLLCEGVGSIPYPKGTVNMVITTPNLVKSYIPITIN
ncbi:MAG: Ig domain protein group 1 domain protein [Syntrophaceae bacterium]|nr:MAG: Ig domain protein group 1 domain protein [Syntrophaceae bacterium]